MLYSDELTSWLKEKKTYLKYSTYTNYCNVIHNHVLPSLGNYQIEELNNDILQEFILPVVKMEKVAYRLNTLKTLFKF